MKKTFQGMSTDEKFQNTRLSVSTRCCALGPLNPDWFEELTVRTSRDEGCPESSKAEENETVKAPETSALASQLFSTPRIFKQRHFPQSPDSISNEKSQNEGANGESSAFPWTESSPCLFGSVKDSPKFDRSSEKPRDCFGLLDTPKRSLARSAKQISESLGAQINPDLSWTSSFNTPPSLTPTLILPTTEDRVPSASIIKDKESIFVRKLFPSLSKDSANAVTLKQDVVTKSESIEADDLGEKTVCSPNESLDISSLWKQRVPNAIEDGDVRNTVQNVLDGAEDVLSIFFSNNTSALRKIKSKERIRKRITNTSKDVKSVFLTSQPEQKIKADTELKSQSKNDDSIQWTPLSLSESILTEGCSSTSLTDNNNTVASSETNDGTIFKCTSVSSQTFSQRVRLESSPVVSECQKFLLDKSSAFILNKKPRKFVYQVASSDMSTTVTGSRADLPKCLDQTLKEGPSVEKLSVCLNKSSFANENPIADQTQPQAVEQLSSEHLDHGLDMTQLSKAFAEEFTQEIIVGELLDMPVQSDQKVQVQSKAEPEPKNKDNNHTDISNLADISVNSPNKSTAITTSDISHDSGCPTTFSDLDRTTASLADISEIFPTFKTANNKFICIPNESILKAKASLDEAAGDGLAKTSNQTKPKHFHATETMCKSVSRSTPATRSPVGQSIFPNHASGVSVSDALKTDSPKRFEMNISNCSLPQSNDSDYKTDSKTIITVSDAGLQTKSLLKENLGRSSESSKPIHQKGDFERSTDRHAVFDISSTQKPTAVDSSCDDLEENGALTASQKADVTELCSLLEEANSQYEFTQFKSTNLGSHNRNTEREWDPDILNDIDFDDSFSCDAVKGKHPSKTNTSSVNTSDLIFFRSDLKEKQNGAVALSVTEGSALVDGMRNVLSKFSDTSQFHTFGFKTAKGKAISISENSLNKTRHFFEEDHKESTFIGVINQKHSKTEPSVKTCMSAENKNDTQTKQDVHFSCGEVNAANNMINWQEAGNAGTEPNCLLVKADVVCVDSNSHFGFSTARGAKLKVSEKALEQARMLLDVDCVDESKTPKLAPHSSGKNVSVQSARPQKTKDLCGGETSIKISQPDSGVTNQISDGADITTFNSKNVFQEQKSSNAAKEVCKKSSPSETFMPQPRQGYGFQTASGKGVSVSSSALKTAKAIFKDCDSNIDNLQSVNMEEMKTKLDVEIVEQTNALILNSKSVTFSDVEEFKTDLINNLDQEAPQKEVSELKGLRSEFSKLIPDNGNCGFSTASGKRVSVSAEALQRAKDVLSESVDGISCANVYKKTNQVVDIQLDSSSSAKHKGFCTAGGKKVAFSSSGLQKAKDLFRDCEEESLFTEDLQQQNCKGLSNVSMLGCNGISFSPEAGNSSGNNVGYSTAGGKKMAISVTALQKANSLLKDCEEESLASSSLTQHGCKGFTTARGKNVTVSEKALSEVRAVFAGCDETSFSLKLKKSSENNVGFSTAGGKKVSISDTALQRTVNLFEDCEEESLGSWSLKHQGCKGFTTASGKDVTVSEKALSEVRAVFAGCDEASFNHEPKNISGNKIGFSTTGEKKVTTAMEKPNNFEDCEEESLAFRNLKHQGCKGFTTASGKNVTGSETALNEVRAVFAGCDEATFSLEPEKSSGNNIGFSTAGGKKVTVSSTALQRAQTLFKDCEEEKEEFGSEKAPLLTKSLHARSEDIVDGNLKFDQISKKNHRLSTASGKVVSVTKVALEETSTFFKEFDIQVTATDNQLLLSDSSKHCPQHKDRQIKATLHPKAARNEPAHLDLHSLDFNSCTDTQQMYFEQEAMACTKALLEDDDLNDSAGLISPSFRDVQTVESVDQNRKRKRQVDASCVADSGQPPLKRQLLSEFDRTLHAKTSGLTPLKSCPNGTLRDRRVFKYNVHLKPYVTSPVLLPVDQKSNNIDEHCSTKSVQKRCNSGHMEGVFIPPFQKGMNPMTSNSQDASKVSSGIVLSFNVVNQEKKSNSKEMDQIMAISKTHCDHGKQYCKKKNQDSKPKSSSSMRSIPLNIGNFDEKDMVVWQESLQLARDMQDMRLRKKKRQTIRPVPGSLYLAKTSGVSRKSLRDAVGCTCPGQYTHDELYQHDVNHKVLEITSENAETFRFNCSDYFKCELLMESGALQLADGGWLVPDSNGTVGKEELFSALCDTPGVDPKLISDAWVFNHYRWIIWKRASMERSFPNLMGGLCLTPEQVLLQLKFRYDVEVDHSQRSALRRIMERDDTPAKTLVLCVCGIVQTCQNPEKTLRDDKTPNAKMESCVIWLTDGWYSIKCLLDPPLSAMLNKGRLKIGDKIVTSGAELVGSQEACPPLEAPESLMLKISANSTRRARWDAKLGYYRDPRPIRLLLSSLYVSGGVVSCVNLLVLRSYPTQWMEKKPNSVFLFRNDRAEDREARKHSNSKHKSVDLLISKIQTQFEKEMEGKKKKRGQRRTFSRQEIETLQDGEELYEAMERDPGVETHLSHKQMVAVSKYRRCIEDKRQADLQERVQKAVMEAQEAEGGCPNRDVTPVWKLGIIDANDLQSNCVYTLNIWRPTRDLQGLLREGQKYRAYHLATSEGKKRSGIAHIQFTATKKTLFQDIEVSPEWLHQHFRARECVRFRELQNPHFSSPCGEVDIVGYIVSIEGKQGHCPVLHLVDENFDLVSVRTYSSLKQLAVEELVKPRALVALCNLQVRLLSGPVPSLFAGEQALFSINPKESYLQEAMGHLKTFVQNYEQFFSIAEEKVSDLVPSGVLGSFQSPSTPGVQPIPKMNGTVTPQQKSSIFSPFTPLNRRSPACTSNSEVKDPKNLKRRRGLDYLSRIPSPPPLIPLKTRASPCINKTFNPPRRSVTPKPPQNECSPASHPPPGEEKWVHDEELAMIDTQALVDGLTDD